MSQTLHIEENLDSSCVKSLVSKLKSLDSKDIVIDAKNVKKIGAFASEILARFKSKVEADGGTVKIIFPSELLDDIRLIGMQDLLIADGVTK